MPPQTRYASCDGLSIAYQVFGKGPHDLVVVPGFLWPIEQLWAQPGYHRLMGALADFARVIVYDKRGTGMSDPVSAAPSLDERMEDVVTVMSAAGSDRATIFGVSEGGPIGVVLAASHPERVEGLITYGAFVCGLDRADAPGGERAARSWTQIMANINNHWGEGKNVEWLSPSIDSPAVRRTAGVVERVAMSPSMARANMSANFAIDVRPILPSVRVPTLVLHRRGDVLPIEQGRFLAAHVAGARFVELEGRDHFPIAGDVDAIVGEIEEFITGTRAPHATDSVLATILFTDIVGSTERAAALGDSAWHAVLREHDDIVRKHLSAYDGREVKTMGDGFLATFDRPVRAVRCATRIAADAAELGLSVRAGLHTGECERRGHDVSGLAVHIGARIGALAEADEVLVSGTVRDLLLGSEIQFVDRGRHTLKGVPGEWDLFAVAGTARKPVDNSTSSASFGDRALAAGVKRMPAVGRMFMRMSLRGRKPPP
nr:adenylate/guanylate cyclase domain-containing protein [Mycolicibacterium malmesburyense]CRL70997.1 lignin peroxidase LipJ [Mycolicibacterium malmesburyense]